MDRRLAYGLVASLLLWPPVVAAIAACLHVLPTGDPADPYREPMVTSRNWVGQDGTAITANALVLLAAVYAAKYLIGHLPARWVRVYAFALLVAASLPFLWLMVEGDWRNWHIYRISCWVYGPIGFWTVPAVSFVADTVVLRTPRPLPYLGRSLLEVVMMVPWTIAWVYFSFFVLGGGWI